MLARLREAAPGFDRERVSQDRRSWFADPAVVEDRRNPRGCKQIVYGESGRRIGFSLTLAGDNNCRQANSPGQGRPITTNPAARDWRARLGATPVLTRKTDFRRPNGSSVPMTNRLIPYRSPPDPIRFGLESANADTGQHEEYEFNRA